MADKTVRVFDMFCGGGGSSRGAAMAGASPVAAVDMWERAIETYSLNFPTATTYRMKAESLRPQRVLDDAGHVDLLLASPECTSHSVAKGSKLGCEKSRETAFQVIRFAKVLKPRWIVVENVPQMEHWRRFKEWRQKLEDLGYQTDLAVLDAQDFDTPQSRRRLFVVCDRKRKPALPEPTGSRKKTVRSILGTGEPRDCPWAFTKVNVKRRAPATKARARRAIKQLGPNEPFIMVYYGTDGAGGFQSLARPLRTVTTLDRFAFVQPNGSGHEMRMLQPTELAAAMGFPACHLWPNTSRRERIKLAGNAVCPPVMQHVITALTQDLAQSVGAARPERADAT